MTHGTPSTHRALSTHRTLSTAPGPRGVRTAAPAPGTGGWLG
ncbi:hypothetical protein ACWFQ8_14035 [Streptomyces sp. NPDC055254]